MTSQHQTPTDVIFVVEGTALSGVYLHELKQHYIIPALEYFAGPIDEKDCGSDSNYCLFGLVVFHAADILPGFLTETHGPLTTSYQLLSQLDRIHFAGGHGEAAAHVGEGLATALQCLQDLSKFRNNAADASDVKKHIILICNCKPYGLPILESVGIDGVHKGQTAEQLASGLSEKDVHLSIIAPRKIPALITLFDRAGGDLHVQKGYARDPRHLVLLNGFQLQVQERPSTPLKVQSAPEVPIPPAPVAVGVPAATSVQTTAHVPLVAVSTSVSMPVPATTAQSAPVVPVPVPAQAKPPVPPLPQQTRTATPPIIPIPASVPVSAPAPAPTTLVQSLQQSIPSLPMPTQQPVPPQPITQPPQAPQQQQLPMQQQAPPQPPPSHLAFRNPRPVQLTRAMLNQQNQQIANQLAQQQLNQQQQLSQQQQLNKQLHSSQQAQLHMQQGPGGQGQQQPGSGQQMGMHQMAGQQQPQLGQPPMNQPHLTQPHLNQQQQLNQSQMNQQAQANMQQQMINQQNQQQQQQLIQQQQQQQRWSSQLAQQAMQQQQELRMGMPGPTGAQQPQAPNPQQLQQRAPEIVRVLNQPPIAQSQSPPTQMGLPQLPLQQANIQKERRNIWSGLLEWHEKLKGPPEGQKVPRQVPCNVSANVINNEPEVTGEGWPAKLIMQLIPKAIVGNLGGSYFMDVKTVAFMLQQCEALASLTRVMESGFAGCVHFTGSGACQIKVLILLYSKDRCAYLGFIPNDQIGFVDRIRKVIQQQKTQQTALRQGQGQGQGAFPPQQPGMPPRMMGMGGQQLLSQQLQQQPGQLPPGQQQQLQQQLQAGQQMQPGQQQQLQQAGQMSLGPQQPPQLQQRQGQGTQGLTSQPSDLDPRELERQRNVLEIQELQRQLQAARQRELELQQIQSGQMSQGQISGNPQNPMQGQQMGMGQQQQTPGQQQMGFSGLQQQQQRQQLLQQQQRGQRPTNMQQTNPGLKSLLQQQSANVGPQFRAGGPGQIAARMQGMHPQQGQQGQEQGGQPMPAQPYDDVRILDLLR